MIIGCVFVNCRFYKCNIINLTSKHSEVKNAIFEQCELIGIHCWNGLLPAGKYAHPIEKLESCYMKYNSLIEMPFRKFDFSANIIQESAFEECGKKAILGIADQKLPNSLDVISVKPISEKQKDM